MSRRERIVIGGAAGLLVLLVGGGLLLPSEVAHSVRATTSAPPELVYELINSPGGWAVWAGAPAASVVAVEEGVGARVAWRLPSGEVLELEVVESHAYTGIAYSSTGDETRRGHITLTPNGSGTQITWEDRRLLSRGPVSRWRGLFESAPMASCIQDLTEVAVVWHQDMRPPPIPTRAVPIDDDVLSIGTGAVYEGQ